MSNVIFTLDELYALKPDALRRLAIYYGVKFNKRTSMKDLADSIYEITKVDVIEEQESKENPMSVRIRRIRASS